MADEQPTDTGLEGLENPDIEKQLSDAIRVGNRATSAIIVKELRRAIDSPTVAQYVEQGALTYIIAAGALAYSGRDVYVDGIARLLQAVNIKPNPEILDAVHGLHLKNHLVYINAFYLLTFLGKEPTIDGVLEVIKAMDIRPDALIAGYVIEFCKEYNTIKYTTMDSSSNLTGKSAEAYRKLSSGAIELSEAMTELVVKEMDKALKNRDMQSHMGPEMIPYLGAVGSLAFSGRDLDSENISKMLIAVGVTPKRELLEVVASLHFKNQLIYVIALYFLITCDIEPNLDYLIKVINALDAHPDALIAGYVIAYYKMKKLSGGFKWVKL